MQRFGLVTPYLDEIQDRILANYKIAGFACPAERHLGDPGNFSFAEISEETIATMCREVAGQADIDAIAIFCTNLRGLSVVEALEAELGVPIYGHGRDRALEVVEACRNQPVPDPGLWTLVPRGFLKLLL